ncbi:hypothetical protein B0I37DRAFT_382528 [Chaetomium sp. MPI-CAGE-AT-0009]|nr:hypothetical protein B0I37DRAFT_382528 [Chaetomium sp. MPI-CAGE-AT-0009]
MPPPKLGEKISLYNLLANVNFNSFPIYLALNEPSRSNNDNYVEYSLILLFHTCNTGYIQHIGAPNYFPRQETLYQESGWSLVDNVNFPLAPSLLLQTSPIQPHGHTDDELALPDIYRKGRQVQTGDRAMEANILMLSWKAPKSDTYWIWSGHGLGMDELLFVYLCAYYLNIIQKIKRYTGTFNLWRSGSGDCTTGGEVNKPLKVINQPRRRVAQGTPFMGGHAGEPRGEATAHGVDEQRRLTTLAAVLERQESMSHALGKMCQKY